MSQDPFQHKSFYNSVISKETLFYSKHGLCKQTKSTDLLQSSLYLYFLSFKPSLQVPD